MAPAAGAQSAATADARAIAAAVDRRYNRLQTLTAEFTARYHGMGTSRHESGMLYLKRPGRMLWDYDTPKEKLFVTDGKTAWFYVPSDRQARKMKLKDLDDLRSPLRYLLGRSRLESEFEGLSVAPDAQPATAGNVVLRGVPKRMAERIEQVLLEINPQHQIERIVIEEVDGSVTEFRFQAMTENQHLPDQRFRFSPPPGVEVLETSELAP